MQAKQQGFTLIELIVVIVILGILSATALPKFIDLGSDARKAVVQGAEGSMRAANAMLYAKAAAAGALGATGSVTVNGTSISTVYGFASSISQLTSAMDLDTSKIVTDSTAGSAGLYYVGYTTSTCGVKYVAATGSSAPPTYTTTVSGC